MAYAVESHSDSPVSALRDALSKAERLAVSVGAQDVEQFLVLLDDIERSIDELHIGETNLQSEQARWEGLLRRIASQPGPIASAAASAGGLKAMRERHPPAENFWWHLDAEVTKRRWNAIRRASMTLIAVVVVLGGGTWAVNRFFPANPEALLMIETQSQLDQKILDSDWEGALEVIDAARVELPDEPDLMIWEAVLAEQAGDSARAEASLLEAQAAMSDDLEQFWVTTGNNRMMVNNLAGAEDAANAALEINPESASAVFLLANIADTRGERMAAIELFERVFALAEKDNPQLAVVAKVRMGQLMQQFDPFEGRSPITTTSTITSEVAPAVGP